MRRTASEVIKSLEMRVARLENKTAGGREIKISVLEAYWDGRLDTRGAREIPLSFPNPGKMIDKTLLGELLAHYLYRLGKPTKYYVEGWAEKRPHKHNDLSLEVTTFDVHGALDREVTYSVNIPMSDFKGDIPQEFYAFVEKIEDYFKIPSGQRIDWDRF